MRTGRAKSDWEHTAFLSMVTINSHGGNATFDSLYPYAEKQRKPEEMTAYQQAYEKEMSAIAWKKACKQAKGRG